jgi:hypothetical protein
MPTGQFSITKLRSSQANNRRHQFFVLHYILEKGNECNISKSLYGLQKSKQHTTPSNEEAGVASGKLFGDRNKQRRAKG